MVDFKVHGIFKADPQKCYDELPEVVTPQNVLDAARDENSELHKCFEWDDTVAAEKYRLKQARMLIQFFVVKTEQEEVIKPRIFQISSERNTYQKAQFFMQNKDEYANLILRAKKEFAQIKNRYKEISEMEEIFDAIDNFINN